MNRRGEISISNRQNNAIVKTIPSGKYTLENLAKAPGKILGEDRGFKVTLNHSKTGMVILSPYKKKVKLDRNLSSLLRIDQRLQETNLISQFTSCNTYLVHCVPLDKDETYIMGNPQAFMVALTLSRASLKR